MLKLAGLNQPNDVEAPRALLVLLQVGEGVRRPLVVAR